MAAESDTVNTAAAVPLSPSTTRTSLTYTDGSTRFAVDDAIGTSQHLVGADRSAIDRRTAVGQPDADIGGAGVAQAGMQPGRYAGTEAGGSTELAGGDQ